MSRTLVLMRHGQSAWNASNRFTGWADVDLSAQGLAEAHHAAQAIKTAGLGFDLAFSSMLKRTIRTLWIVLDELDQMWLPAHHVWQLNGRHYGALQGRNKAAAVAEFGAEQVHAWRRGFEDRPPVLDPGDERHPCHDARYAGIDPLPAGESLAMAQARLLSYWQTAIEPHVRAGERVLVVAHGNILRALIKHLATLSNEEVRQLEVPTATPLVITLDDDLRLQARTYLRVPN